MECESYEYKYDDLNRECDRVYTEVFYKSMHGPDGPFKEKCMGEKIVINGVDFFTDSRNTLKEERALTHGRSGILCGTASYVKDNFAGIAEKEKEYPDVISLPDVPAEND